MYICTRSHKTDKRMKWLWPCVLLLLIATATQAATLVAYAELAADTFVPGPTSGQFIKPVNDREPPFINQQPVQGFSALLIDKKDSFLALSDNGFGQRDNSSDYLLSIYLIQLDLRTASGGNGVIHIKDIVHLSDPGQHLPYARARKSDHLLTGADLDPESFQRDTDGTILLLVVF